jgi:hypothetical protein
MKILIQEDKLKKVMKKFLFEQEKPKDKIVLVHHSNPQRGLSLLVDVFERLCEEYDNIEKSSKADGSWLKSIDGKPWSPTKEAKELGLELPADVVKIETDSNNGKIQFETITKNLQQAEKLI